MVQILFIFSCLLFRVDFRASGVDRPNRRLNSLTDSSSISCCRGPRYVFHAGPPPAGHEHPIRTGIETQKFCRLRHISAGDNNSPVASPVVAAHHLGMSHRTQKHMLRLHFPCRRRAQTLSKRGGLAKQTESAAPFLAA